MGAGTTLGSVGSGDFGVMSVPRLLWCQPGSASPDQWHQEMWGQQVPKRRAGGQGTHPSKPPGAGMCLQGQLEPLQPSLRVVKQSTCQVPPVYCIIFIILYCIY